MYGVRYNRGVSDLSDPSNAPVSSQVAEPPPAGTSSPPAESVTTPLPVAETPSQGLTFADTAAFDAAVDARVAQQQQDLAAAAQAEEARAAQANMSPFVRMAPAALGLTDSFADGDSIGTGILTETTDVVRKMAAWELRSADVGLSPADRRLAQTELANGQRALSQLQRDAQMHQHYVLQQTPAETIDATANREATLAEFNSQELNGQIKDVFPHVHAALFDAKTITVDALVREIDFGRADVDDQVVRLLARHDNAMMMLAGHKVPDSTAGTTATDTGTPAQAPGNAAAGAPGESAGYSGGGSGQELSAEDYFAQISERSRSNLAN